MYVTDVPVMDRITDNRTAPAGVALEQLEDAIFDAEGGCECNDCVPYVFPSRAFQAVRDAVARLSDAVLTTA